MNDKGRKLLEGVGPIVPLIQQKQNIQLRHVMQDGPTAVPVVVNGLLPGGDGVQILASFGGLTKLEALAGQIAGHLVQSLECDDVGVAEDAVNLAQAVLDECRRRQTQQAEA